MGKSIVQYKIEGFLNRDAREHPSEELSEIISKLHSALLVHAKSYQSAQDHSCAIIPGEKTSFVDIVINLPQACLAAPLSYAGIIYSFVQKAMDKPMLTLDAQIDCPSEHFYVIEAYDSGE